MEHPPKSNIKASILSRVKLLYLAFFILGVAVLAKIIWIQAGTDASQLRSQGEQYSYRNEILEAARGNILSDDNRLLATSIPYYELRMDMQAKGLTEEVFNENIDALSQELASFFKDKSAGQYKDELIKARREGKRYYPVTRHRINYLDLQQIKKFPLFGLGPNKGGFLAVEQGRRIKPHGELANRTIGFVNSVGLRLGIEGGFQDDLKGIDGITYKQKVSGSFWIPISDPRNIEPINGKDIVTTINIEMQDIVQAALRERLLDTQADWGTVIVMEVGTGHVKAIANATRKSDREIIEDYNYAIGMSLEPGSTFKLAGLIALLEDGKMPIDTPIDTEGGLAYIGPVRVVDSHRGDGVLSLQQVFEKSSNVGMAKAVNRVYGSNPGRFAEALSNLGLSEPLGLQIAGEAKPLIKHPKSTSGWDGMTLTMMSYGYALRITPMQTLTLCNAVANGGKMVKPLFVKEQMQYGQVIESYSAEEIIPQICSARVLKLVQQSMEGVVLNGTARSIRSPHYTIAAKTGTAQIAQGRRGYHVNGGKHYLGSIVGYFPADKPRYSIMIALKTFHRDGSLLPYYGGALAGPLFKTIADRIFTGDYDFIEPITPTIQPLAQGLTAKAGDSQELETVLHDMKFAVSPIAPGTMAVIDSSRVKVVNKGTSAPGTMPDVRGMALGEAVTILEKQGLRVRIAGMGSIKEQIPEPNTPVNMAQEVMLNLEL